MRNSRFIVIMLMAVLLVGAGALSAAAAGPTNTSPTAALVIDNGTHAVPANSSLWYRFDYAGDRSSVTVTLANATNSGLGFNVYTPQQIGDWWDESPIGRGTAQALNCDTGLPEDNGACQSNDLTWVGNFNANGTYYVEVVNNTNSDMGFTVTIQGSGVTLAAPAAAASTQGAPAAAPVSQKGGAGTPAPVTASGLNLDPGHALVIGNAAHSVPANGSLWYRFDYAGDRSDITITMTNGAGSGMGFNVYTPAQISDWWNESPIGRGTAQAINCDTGEPEAGGACQANDLTWVGSFNATGTYYVQVFNNNPIATSAQITIQGDGVTLGQ